MQPGSWEPEIMNAAGLRAETVCFAQDGAGGVSLAPGSAFPLRFSPGNVVPFEFSAARFPFKDL